MPAPLQGSPAPSASRAAGLAVTSCGGGGNRPAGSGRQPSSPAFAGTPRGTASSERFALSFKFNRTSAQFVTSALDPSARRRFGVLMGFSPLRDQSSQAAASSGARLSSLRSVPSPGCCPPSLCCPHKLTQPGSTASSGMMDARTRTLARPPCHPAAASESPVNTKSLPTSSDLPYFILISRF